MIYVLASAALALGLAAVVALVVVLAREIKHDLAEQLACSAHALAAQLAAHHEEQRRHIDAAAAAIVVQLAALPSRSRSIAPVEVRRAPPLRHDATPPAGTPRPQGAA